MLCANNTAGMVAMLDTILIFAVLIIVTGASIVMFHIQTRRGTGRRR